MARKPQPGNQRNDQKSQNQKRQQKKKPFACPAVQRHWFAGSLSARPKREKSQNDRTVVSADFRFSGEFRSGKTPSMKLARFLVVCALAWVAQAAPLPVLIIDGQNNHNFRFTTPHLKKILEETGLFQVDVATTPGKGGDMTSFQPEFKKYRAVISNYNGEPWSADTRKAFVEFVRNGGGFVSVHAADNSFPDWLEYNQMIAVGGWEGRNEKSGPYLRFRDGHWVRDTSPGVGGSHGKQHAFLIETRVPDHPITRGLPARWLHAKDELYDRLSGPAENVVVLASAFSARETNGSGEHEPSLMVISFGGGRVFHTTMGHNNGADITSQKCAGFITTFQRGAEWAATGQVTQKVPADFPTEENISLRESEK
jgi:type 1 glutamine amidotransferase